MTFENLLTNQIMVARLVTVSGNRTAYSTVTAEYDVSIQRMSETKTVALGGAIGQMFRLYTEESVDIEKGDKLKDENGSEYRVVSIQKPAEIGSIIHKEAIITKVKHD